MKFRKYIQIGPWMPDASDRENITMEKADNSLPVFGSHRSIRGKSVSSTTDVSENINNVFMHFYTADVSKQIGVTIDDVANSAGEWVVVPGDAGEIWEPIDDVVADDSMSISVGGAPSSESCTIKLTELVSPAPGNRDIRYRYKITGHSGANWTLDFTVNEPADGSTYTETKQETGSADTDGWVEGSFTLTGTGSVSDWTDLWLKITATVSGSGNQAIYPDSDTRAGDWSKNDDSTDDLFDALDADSPVDNTYIQSKSLSLGESSYVEVGFPPSTEDPLVGSHVLNWRHNATNEDVNLKVALYEGVDTKIAEKDVGELPTSFAADSLTLTSAEVDSITDYSNLRARITASTSDSGTDSQTTDYYPGSLDINNDNWTKTGSSYEASVGDNSDSVSSALSPVRGDHLRFYMPHVTDPGFHTGHKLRVEAKAASAGKHLGVSLHQQLNLDIIPLYQDFSLTTSYAWYEIEAAEAHAALITNYSLLRSQLWVLTDGVQVDVRRFYLEVGAPLRAQISQVSLSLDDGARAAVSMFNLETPTSQTESSGDVTEIYAGTPSKLWKVASSGFSDVSVAANYQQGNPRAPTWSFTSWGEDVIATNYIDPVQTKAPGDSLFSDLITSTAKPQARYVANVGNFLVLGKINYNSADHGGSLADGQWDEVWWSGFEDSADFDPSARTQCDRQRLFSTPGEVTGIVGGEYGVVFKRTSIYRMDYVGSDIRFYFRLLSINEGTRYFRSIVQVGNDIYFYGNGSFRVIRNGEQLDPNPLGYGKVMKTMIDPEYEDRAIRIVNIYDQIEKDAVIVGDYDRLTGLIYWVVRGAGDDPFRASRIFLYNPTEDRFGYVTSSNLRAASVVSKPVSDDAGVSLTRNLVGIGMGTDSSPSSFDAQYFTFTNEATYPSTFESNIFSTRALLGEEIAYRNISINRARLIFRGQPDSTDPNVSIKIDGSEHPLMLTADTTSDTTDKEDEDLDGMRAVNHVTGSYFRFTVDIPALTGKSIKDVDGIEIEGETHGEF